MPVFRLFGKMAISLCSETNWESGTGEKERNAGKETDGEKGEKRQNWTKKYQKLYNDRKSNIMFLFVLKLPHIFLRHH